MKLSSFVEQYFNETYLSCWRITKKRNQPEKKPKKKRLDKNDIDILGLLVIFKSINFFIF